ncbi:MAG: hypothetical protein HYR62_02995 [Actinobacteria bacterium]|nr:hypothetical protein [Actinomycetota bacterium]MBI3687437.1 hypothetical protein [Actinomycetota bacterium]
MAQNPASKQLLVYLVVHRNGASLDDIMEAIWGDATARRAAERLSTCVANLRHVLRTATNPPPSATNANGEGSTRTRAEPVVNTGGHYHLNPQLVDVDWWQVLDEYTQVATATDDATRLTHLNAAITHVGGGLAEGADYDWIDTDREHTRRRLVKIYAQAAQLLTDTNPRQAHTHSETACGLDPLSEELARRAMHTAARLGDADAIRTRLATLRRELDEAGIDLDPDTTHLATTLLRDLATP